MSKKKPVKGVPAEEQVAPEVEQSVQASDESPAVEQPIMAVKTVKIYMNYSVDTYNAHMRYRVDESVLDTLPVDSYIVIG